MRGDYPELKPTKAPLFMKLVLFKTLQSVGWQSVDPSILLTHYRHRMPNFGAIINVLWSTIQSIADRVAHLEWRLWVATSRTQRLFVN